MKKIKALQNYTDTVLKKDIKAGEEYIVDNERAETIVKVIFKDKPLAEIIEDVKVYKGAHRDINTGELITEPMKESIKEDKPKTTTKKKVTKKK